jgi:molecular chaperone DnaK
MAVDNVSLGMFNLTGIPPAPRGIPQIEVTFDIDADGILNVSAKDLATGKEQKITITASTKLSDQEKDRMMKEAEQFAEEDEKRKKEIEVLNEADSLLYTAEKTKTDLADKIGKEQIEKIEKAESELRSILSSKDIEKIKTKSQELTKVLQEVGTVVYQQAAAQQAQQAKTDQSEKTKEKVVDAEYEEVKENKKE